MTRAEIRSLILQWLDDPQGGYFTSDVVNTWINLAQREVQKYLLQAGENYYVTPVETATVQAQADYVLPNDFVKLHRLELVLAGTGVNEDKAQLVPMSLNQAQELGVQTAQPVAYVLGKSRMTLFPSPDRNYTLRLFYTPRVADMSSDSDIPDVPEDYHELIAILAAKNGFIKDDRTPTNLIEKEQEYRKLMKESAEDRKEDQSRYVIMSSDDDSFNMW